MARRLFVVAAGPDGSPQRMERRGRSVARLFLLRRAGSLLFHFPYSNAERQMMLDASCLSERQEKQSEHVYVHGENA